MKSYKNVCDKTRTYRAVICLYYVYTCTRARARARYYDILFNGEKHSSTIDGCFLT